jgi:hypothetical protein
MRKRFRRALLLAVFCAAPLASAQPPPDVLYRVSLLRAAPGRLLDLVAALRASGLAAPGARSLVLRHAQGDHWDLMALQPLASYAAHLEKGAPAVAPAELLVWQEDVFVRGPELPAAFREAGLYHAELFHAGAGKRAELLKERAMENAYLRALGRPENALFVRELGGSWDCFTLGAYKGWKHYAEREDIPREKSQAAAVSAGFSGEEQISPYLRSLILDHHDSLLTPVR